jgi:AbrB family looped-hinge helix DNA binding protein
MDDLSGTVSTKGQLVIPSAIRDALDIRPGTRVVMIQEENRIILQPVNERFLKETRGITAGGRSLSDMLIEERRQDEAKRVAK